MVTNDSVEQQLSLYSSHSISIDIQVSYLCRFERSHLGVEDATEDRECFVVVDDVRKQLQHGLTRDASKHKQC